MSEVVFSFNDAQVVKKINQLGTGLKSLRRPMEDLATEFLAYYGEDVFADQGSPLGESWRSLKPSTLHARAKRIGYYKQSPITTDKILIWTGRLKKGFQKEVSDKMLRIYNTVPYYKYQQVGGRRMLGITSHVVTRTTIVISDFISNSLN